MKDGDALIRNMLGALRNESKSAIPPAPIEKLRRMRATLHRQELVDSFTHMDFSNLKAGDTDPEYHLILPALVASKTVPEGASPIEGTESGYIVYWVVSSHAYPVNGRMVITLELDRDRSGETAYGIWKHRSARLVAMLEREDGPTPIDEWLWIDPQTEITVNRELSEMFASYYEKPFSLNVNLVQTEAE